MIPMSQSEKISSLHSRIGKETACRKCGERIVFVRLKKKNSDDPDEKQSFMPCNATLYRGDEKATLVTGLGEVKVKANSLTFGRIPHWATCSRAQDFRT